MKEASDNVTISTYKFLRRYPDEESARRYLEERRWHGQLRCPSCASVNIYARTGERTGYYLCRDCSKEFTVRTGTIFDP